MGVGETLERKPEAPDYGKGQSAVLKKSAGALKNDTVTTSVLAGWRDFPY